MSSLADQPTSEPGRDSSIAAGVERLYRSHAGLVRSVCCSILRDRVEAEDAAQQTFLSAQRALINGSAPRDAAAWLATIARNESLARVRARMREPLTVELEEHGAAPDVHATASQRYEASELRDALEQLPGQQRAAILLREVRGLSSQEVATALSVTTYAAESLVCRARRSLRTQLQGAFAGLSPGLFVQPLRGLATRATGGGLAAPAAAKAAAVGVGALVVTGGALVGPRALGLGHGLSPFNGASRLAAGRPTHAAAPHASVPLSSNLTLHDLHDQTTVDSDHATGNSSISRGNSDPQRTSNSPSIDSSGSSAANNNARTNTGNSPGNDNTQQDASGGPNTGSLPGTGDAGSTDSGSNSQNGDNSNNSQPSSTAGDSGQGD
jgi:RNA polymerase sigma-70 factor (ECF subfamily)